MRITISLVLILIILVFVAGCGPGQPFEIESLHTPQPVTPPQLASAASW
jgi:hypothetical protein